MADQDKPETLLGNQEVAGMVYNTLRNIDQELLNLKLQQVGEGHADDVALNFGPLGEKLTYAQRRQQLQGKRSAIEKEFRAHMDDVLELHRRNQGG